ncbi:alpha/beta hydrolase domain-containing protein [Sinomonas susongensis]|uniref:alpha/beta hydrolase domain-containing protein n=1 Tax=Sinomonas susongensis TaxID=1324851 RepID=UPI0011094508|nr:alpha/beta hydrolase domain-containing protein [Sinomonas susongensis]
MTITKIAEPRETTASDRPYQTGWAGDGELGLALESAGYVEEEIVVEGTAATFVYDDDFHRQPAEQDVPYVTRVLVRRPADPSKASGLVCFEPLHPGMDADLTWRSVHPWIAREGHVWVGATVTPRWAEKLAASGEWNGRYERLSIPAMGLQWQITADVLTVLRGEGLTPALSGSAVSRLIMSGWSMTGTFCRVFLRDGFHEDARTPDGSPAVDGYLIAISSGGFLEGGYQPLSDGCMVLPREDARRTISNHGVPVIELLSEGESETHASVLREDSDHPGDPYRLYEIAGACHGSVSTKTGWPGDAQADRMGIARGARIREMPSTFPIEHVARAAFAHLDRWITDGIEPPRAPRLRFGEGNIKGGWPECVPLERDELGNAVGGVRSTHVDVPIATYVPHSTIESVAGTAHPGGDLYGHMVPFSAERLRALYGKPEEYRRRVERRSAEILHQGWLLAPERDAVVAAAETVSF